MKELLFYCRQWNSLQWQQETDPPLIFATSMREHTKFTKFYYPFCKAVLRVPAFHGNTEGTELEATVQRGPNPLQGCACSPGSLGFDPWFNSKDTLAEISKIPSSFLPVCCHLGIVWVSSKTMKLHLCHRCNGTEVLLITRLLVYPYLPVIFSMGLFYLISVFPAVQFFHHYLPFPPRSWWASSTLPWQCWPIAEFTKCCSQHCSSRNFCSLPSRTAPKLDPAFDCERYEDPTAGC